MTYLPWILLTILYTPVFWQLYQSRWENIDYTHAYFILPIALLMCVLKRDRIKEAVAAVSQAKKVRGQGLWTFFGLIFMLFGLGLYLIGWRWDFLVITTLSFIIVVLGILLFQYGLSVIRLVAFPLAYLLLMVPPPLGVLDSITLPLRYLIAALTEIILSPFFNMHRQGLMIFVGDTRVFMGEACSGFRSLVTMIALALIYIYFTKGSLKRRILLLIAVVPLALFGNLARVIVLCLVTYYFGEEVGQGFFHYFSGAVIFLVMILGLMLLGNFLKGEEE